MTWLMDFYLLAYICVLLSNIEQNCMVSVADLKE